MKNIVLSLITVFCFVCSVNAQNTEKEYVQLSDPVEETDQYRVFGSSFDEDVPAASLGELIQSPQKFDSKTVTTEGTIKQVCRKKGCFFMLETEEAAKPARITFKDYSFFIPTNTAGSRVKLNGTFNVKTISEEDAKHFAEDAGKDPNAIKGPQKEYALVATSVVIYK